MKQEDQVTSPKLSKKLADLGVKQDSKFYWRKYSLCEKPRLYYIPDREMVNLAVLSGKLEYEYSAFSVAELGSKLKDKVEMPNYDGKTDKDWYFKGEDGKKYLLNVKNEAEARGQMLTYLRENKLIV